MKRPLECLAGGFVLGEVLALLPVAWIAGILAVFLAGVCYLRKKFGRSLVWWFLPFFVIWGFGWHQADIKRVCEYEMAAEAAAGADTKAEGTVRGIQGRKDRDGVILELSDVVLGEGESRCKYGNLLLYLDEYEEMHIGERVCAEGRLERFAQAGNPGEFDLECYYHAAGIEGRFFGKSTERMQKGYSRYLDGIYRLKCHGAKVIDLICTKEDSGIFRAMVLGEKTELSADIKKLYQSSGISHLLAVSGLHISMIGIGCYHFVRKMGTGFAGAGILGMGVTVSYGILAGGTGITASVNRAVFMVLMQMGADWLGRTYDMRSAVSIAGLLLLLQSPQLLFQAGFQLSFGAVLALGIAEPLAERWLKPKKGWQKALLAGTVIQLATCPIIVYHYFEYPVYGIFLNLIVIPLMSYVLLSGILGVTLGCVWLRAGIAAVGTGHYVLAFYQWICEKVQMMPGAVMVTGRPQNWQIGLYSVLWCGFLASMAMKIKKEKAEGKHSESECIDRGMTGFHRAVFLMLFAGMNLGILLYRCPVNGMEVTFLDVGQGDGICIRTEDGVILTDGGSTDKKNLGTQVLEPFLKCQGIDRVDYAIVSHGDQDHISGLMELMEGDCGIRIRQVILPWLGQGGDEIYERIAETAQKHGAKVAWMKRGDRIVLGDMRIDCLYAGEEGRKHGSENGDRNEHSLLLEVKYGLAGILLTGDMSAEGERQWLEKGETPKIQVLKTAHHGSSYSTEEEFLERIKPQWAVISCGKGNRYGHPGEDTLERLKNQGIKWYTTMDTGAITVKTDGVRMEIEPFSDPPGRYFSENLSR